MNNTNTNTTPVNNIYLRVAVILLAINFIVNGYFVYSLLKVNEMSQDATATTNKIFTRK